MKLYNPTIETIVGGYDGVPYYIHSGKVISVSDETGRWVLDHNRARGLVALQPPLPISPDFDMQTYVVKQTLEGLQAYIQMKEDVLESFQSLDSELKAQNVYGTILTKKSVKQVIKDLETAVAIVKDLEAKHGISIMKQEIELKAKAIVDSIDATVAMFEEDVEHEVKSSEQEKALDKMIKESLPPEAFMRA